MRTHLFRGVLALAVALTVSAPAYAQSIMKGVVLDAAGQPIEGASIVFESADGGSRKAETKTNKKGEFLQVGLTSGAYKVTATKDKLAQSLNATVRQRENPPLNFRLTPVSGMSQEEQKAQAALGEAAKLAMDAMRAGNNDEAIAKFQEIVAKVPNCSDCYYNMGVAHSNKQQWAEAEAAFLKAVELKPSGEAYTGLANVYNAQRKSDQAVAMSQKAAEFAGPGGANAESLYNQGVVLWNAGKYAEAKTQFESAVKTDPNMALAHYQLGMACLNLGQIPEAVAAFEAYLNVDPNGAKAAEVKGYVSQLKK